MHRSIAFTSGDFFKSPLCLISWPIYFLMGKFKGTGEDKHTPQTENIIPTHQFIRTAPPTPLTCLQPTLAMCPMDNQPFVWAPGNWKLYDVYAFLIDITSMVVKKWICLSLVSQSNTFSVPSTSLHWRLLLLTAGGYAMPSLFPITPSVHSIPKCSGVTTRLHEASVSLDRGHFFSVGIAGS